MAKFPGRILTNPLKNPGTWTRPYRITQITLSENKQFCGGGKQALMLAGFWWNALFYCRGLSGKVPALIPKCVVKLLAIWDEWVWVLMSWGKKWAIFLDLFWLLCCWVSWQATPDIYMVSNPVEGQVTSGHRGDQLPRTGMGIAASLYLWNQGMKQASDLLHVLSRIKWFCAPLKQNSSTGYTRQGCHVRYQLNSLHSNSSCIFANKSSLCSLAM